MTRKDSNAVEITYEDLMKNSSNYIAFSRRDDLPISVSFKFAKVLKEITDELVFIEEQKHKTLKRFNIGDGSSDEDKEKLDRANEEWSKFIKKEKFKMRFEPIKISSVVDKDGKQISIEPRIMQSLLQFFEE